MITLFDSRTNQLMDITDIQLNPTVKWALGVLLSGAISWAGWSTNELIAAKAISGDVKTAIERMDNRYNSIDRRLERIEAMLMDGRRGR